MSETGPISAIDAPDDTGTEPPVALITGAARGIGRAIATRLVADGWQTLLLDKDETGLRDTAAALGGGAHALEIAQSRCARQDGGRRSASSAGPSAASWASKDTDDGLRSLKVANGRWPQHCTIAVLRHRVI